MTCGNLSTSSVEYECPVNLILIDKQMVVGHTIIDVGPE
jgi:hypothetical protein